MDGSTVGDRNAGADAKASVLDLRGLKCPLPALRTERALRALHPDNELAVLADDPLAPLDIAHLCRTSGHVLLVQTEEPGGGWRFRIRRGGSLEASSGDA